MSSFVVEKKLGEGAYARVYKISKNNKTYALKRNVVEEETGFFVSVRELDILVRCRGHPNIVHLDSISYDGPFQNLLSPIKEEGLRNDTIYFLLQCADMNLEELIDERRELNDPFTIETIRVMMYQMLLSVEYLHLQKLVHRDLKSANFLIIPNPLNVLLCDFGLTIRHSNQGNRTPRVCTPDYRAPEVWLCVKKYTEKIDIWSMGCILFEMVRRDSFIRLGENQLDDGIRHIIRRYPEPLSFKDVNELGGKALSGRLPKSTHTWESYFPNIDSDLLDLLKKMMAFNPQKRYTASECLNHKFFDQVRPWITKVRNNFSITPFKYDIDYNDYTRNLLKQLANIMEENSRSEWFHFRVFFITINLILRYTAEIVYSEKHLKHVELHVYVMIYLSIKYVNTLKFNPEWRDVAPSHLREGSILQEADKFEKFLLDCLDYKVYTDTPYDVATRELGRSESFKLFDYCIDNPKKYTGLMAEEVYKNFVKNGLNKSIESSNVKNKENGRNI
jgi:serine/threonine protein kinase